MKFKAGPEILFRILSRALICGICLATHGVSPTFKRKFFMRINIIAIILTIACVKVSANGYGQVISLTSSNTALTHVFAEIEKQTGYSFFWKTEKLSDIKISIRLKKVNLNYALQKLTENSPYKYYVVKKSIVLVAKEPVVDLPGLYADTASKGIKITGVVTDTTGTTLPGVSVVVKGLKVSTMTDADGRYSISGIMPNARLVFSYVGMTTKEVPVNGKINLNVVLMVDDVHLNEIVVVGYGTVKKKDVTGSISTVNSKELQRGNPVDVLSGIQGKMPGVKITTSSGDPGGGVSITVRGKSSISAGTTPLFVIDGMPYDYNPSEIASQSQGDNNSSNPMSRINPADIESVTVLKDASATSIYGSRGANGVILIQTKSGKKGLTLIDFDSNFGPQIATRKIPVLNGNEFIEFRRNVDPDGILFYNNGDLNKPRDPYALKQHNWQDEILMQGFQQNYNLSMSGKKNETTYLASVGYLNNKAIVKNSENERYTMRLKLESQKNEKLLLGLNTSGGYAVINGATQSGGGTFFNGIVQNLVVSTPVELYNPSFDPSDVYISPTSMIDKAYRKTATIDFNSNAFLNYAFTPKLKLIATGSGAVSSSKGAEFYGKTTSWGVGDNGYGNLNEARSYSVNASAQLHYTNTFAEKHNLNAMFATESSIYNYEWFGLTQTQFLDESTGVFDISKGSTTKNVGSFKDMNKRVSVFSRVNYTYQANHILTVNFRVDGSDKFGPGNRFGYFPSAAYSWLLIDEKFMQEQSLFSNAKIRLSYGASGNDRIPSYQYLARLENTYYGGVLGMAPSSQSNDQLKWETTNQSNLGFDMGFLKERLTATVDIYKKQTHDMLIPTPTPGRTGYFQQWQNIGRVDNSGIEIQLSSKNIDHKNFKWSTDINISRNRNKVIDLGAVDFIPVNVPGGWIQSVGRVSVGRPIGEAYGYVFDGVYQMGDFTWQNGSDPNILFDDRVYQVRNGVVGVNGVNVKPGSFKFKDLNQDGTITLDEDRTSIGLSDPKFFGGFNNSFQFKNFDLNIFVEGSYGSKIFNESKYRLEGGALLTYMNITKDFYYNHWTPETPSNIRGDYADRNATSLLASSYYVEDGSYLRLRSLTIGYNLKPSTLKSLKIASARVYVAGNNLYTLTKYSGYDPEVDSGNTLMSGLDRISYPRARTIFLGLNVSF